MGPKFKIGDKVEMEGFKIPGVIVKVTQNLNGIYYDTKFSLEHTKRGGSMFVEIAEPDVTLFKEVSDGTNA